MPFGSLSAEQRAVVLLQLKGAAQYATQMGRAALQTGRLALATGKTGFAMQNAAKKTWLMNQATFTLRRYTFYATLALTTAAAAAIKLGVSYLSSMQTARVALRPVFNDQQALNNELRQLFILGKYSPFVLADMTTAFRVMYPALHTAGLGVDYMNKVLKAMVDALSFAGKTSPAALNRVSYALQHMLFQGRLTGRVVQQLGQLGVPVMPILNRYLGITADQLHNIAALNISPQSFLNAFVNFVNTTPGYRGAALRLSLQSFHGLLQVTRDSLSQIIGVLLRPAFAGGQSWLFNIAKPGGPLDRLSNISTAGGFSAVIISLSRMLTGNGMAGRGILLFTDTLHNLWRIFTTEVIPAFAIALGSLTLFYPVLKLLNWGLGILAHHTTLVKTVLIPLAAWFIITHTAALGLWSASKLITIATFGEMGIFLKMIGVLRALTAATITWTAALDVNPVVLIVTAVVALGFALYMVIFRFDQVKRKMVDLVNWLQRNSLVWRLISWATGGGFSPPAQRVAASPPPGGALNYGGSVISRNESANAGMLAAATSGGNDGRPIQVNLVVDRRTLASAVARANQDQAARR